MRQKNKERKGRIITDEEFLKRFGTLPDETGPLPVEVKCNIARMAVMRFFSKSERYLTDLLQEGVLAVLKADVDTGRRACEQVKYLENAAVFAVHHYVCAVRYTRSKNVKMHTVDFLEHVPSGGATMPEVLENERVKVNSFLIDVIKDSLRTDNERAVIDGLLAGKTLVEIGREKGWHRSYAHKIKKNVKERVNKLHPELYKFVLED